MTKPLAATKASHADTPVSPWAPASVREQQREVKRNAVLQAAAQMFNERGFHATSLDDVAARLHVSKPTLYYYVKSKDEILFECVRAGLQMMQAGIAETSSRGGSAIEQLVACMRTYGQIVTMDFGMCLIRIGEDPLPPESRKELRRAKSAIDLEFRRLIAAGMEEGSLVPCDPKITAFAIAGALSWIGRWYQPGGDYSAEEVVERVMNTLLGSLLTPGSRASRARSKIVPKVTATKKKGRK
ncbi:MAG: TetR family transcriptional regulator [Burkholderiales bacterium]|jgi:AcrR family transcriptional regulator|nr:TetR family transcriptional regulator [Burkholderiales bacterium]MBP8018631.1 TetR family transcriptional regulator [Hylemonella sp.]